MLQDALTILESPGSLEETKGLKIQTTFSSGDSPWLFGRKKQQRKLLAVLRTVRCSFHSPILPLNQRKYPVYFSWIFHGGVSLGCEKDSPLVFRGTSIHW